MSLIESPEPVPDGAVRKIAAWFSLSEEAGIDLGLWTWQQAAARRGWSDPNPMPFLDLFPRLSRLARGVRRA